MICKNSPDRYFSLLVGVGLLLHRHDSQFGVARAETEVGAAVRVGQAEDGPRHVADDAKDMTCLVVEETNLVASSSSRHNDVLFVVELSCVDEWCGRLSREGFTRLYILVHGGILVDSLAFLLCEIDFLVLLWFGWIFLCVLHLVLELLALLFVVL